MNETIIHTKVFLNDEVVGTLEGFPSEKIYFTFASSFIEKGVKRNLFSLFTQDITDEESTLKRLEQGWVSNQVLPAFFSNLLPEGSMREYIANFYDISIQNEFPLLLALGHDLPGAVTMDICDEKVIKSHKNKNSEENLILPIKFSLSGIKPKFSMYKKGERYTLRTEKMGDWIVKLPSNHPYLPENEYSCMKLAETVGIEIPEVSLVSLDKLELPSEFKENDKLNAYTIKRFDRNNERRIHVEDFAQIFGVKPRNKYEEDTRLGENLPIIMKTLGKFSLHPLRDQGQVIKRVVVNILLGNGDAHLKNWGVIYKDGYHPELTPAYDIVFTEFYMRHDGSLSMKVGGEKTINKITKEHFEVLAEKSGVNKKFINEIIEDTLEQAREKWPSLLYSLPMEEEQKEALNKHWRSLALRFL